MKIVMTTDFLRGRAQLKRDAGYEVTVKNGWQLIGFSAAREPTAGTADDLLIYTLIEDDEFGSDAPAPAADGVTLTVQDINLVIESPKVEV